MALKKSPGPPLTSIYKGVIDAIPLRWRTKLGITRVVQKQPTDVTPDNLTSTLVASSVEQELTDERKKTNVTLTDPTGQTMVEYIRTKDGQVGTRTVKYVPEGTVAPTFTELIKEFNQDASGNGWSEQITVTVPNLFQGYDYSIERRDNVPPEFGALLQTRETSYTVAGTAAMPTLGVGELMRREQQVDEQTKRITVRDRDIATLPKIIVNYDTSRAKQIVTITRIWELDTTTPAVPTATLDVSFEKLGDGTAIETRKSEAVFPGPVYAKSIESLIPPKFRAHIPTATSEITSTGIADPNPTLATGELSHEEQQVDAFNKRTKSVNLGAISPPVTFTDVETTEEFGGGVLDVIYTLNTTGSLSVDTGLRVVASEVTNLGNGYDIKTTKRLQASEWSELSGTEVDPRTGIVVTVKKKVVASGTTGGVGVDGYVDVKSLDIWRSIRIASKLDPTSLPGTVTWETTVEHRFENTLLGAQLIWAQAWTEDSYDFDSALLLDIVQGYAGPCRAKITESFSNGAPGATVTVTKFFPQGHMVAIAWSYANGDSGVARAAARTFSISPTLHGEIDLGTALLQEHGGRLTASRTLPATVPVGLPPSGSLITKNVDVERWRFGIFFRRLTEIYVP